VDPRDTPSARCHGERRKPGYAARRPEESLLHGVVQRELESFLAHAQARDRPVPRFVERELRGFLGCGVLAHGFVRVHCDACGLDRLVAFSCKGRGFCPSCGGRRMADTAAHLVDRVLPEVPIRQWVLSLPYALRYRLAYDAALTSAVLGVFVRAVFASLRRRSRRQWGIERAQCGAVTFVQRFGDALNLNVHFHSLVLDGVYAQAPCAPLRFHALPPPEDAEVAHVVSQVARRVARLLERRGSGPEADADSPDPLAAEQPLLAALYGASVSGGIATGRRAGRRVRRLGDRIDADDLRELEGERCASTGGVSLHANVAVPARDRRRLERLCRYAARPPVSTERLSGLDDGRLLYRLRHRWRDGTTHVLFEPAELLEKLAALVPPPRFHLVRYHGILGPAAGRRPHVVPNEVAPGDSAPAPPNASERPIGTDDSGGTVTSGPTKPGTRVPRIAGSHLRRGPDASEATGATARPNADASDSPDDGPGRARRLAWADLLRRVFAVDVLECPRCGGRMRLLATIHPPEATRAILECLGLPARAPPLTPARPETDLASADGWDVDCEAGA
jgi:hypothetical protein